VVRDPEAAARRCIAALASEDEECRALACGVLVRLAGEAVPALRGAIEDGSASTRRLACWVSSRMEEAETVALRAPLGLALRSPDPAVRSAAACSLLGTAEANAARREVAALLRSGDPAVPRTVAEDIAWFNRRCPTLVAPLSAAIGRATGRVRIVLCRALLVAGGEEAWPVTRIHLIAGLRSKDEALVEEAIAGLCSAGMVAFADVEVELSRPEAHVRRNACLALGRMEDDDAFDLLTELAGKDPDKGVREAAAKALASLCPNDFLDDVPFTGPSTNSAIGLGGGSGAREREKEQEAGKAEKPR